MRAIVEGFGLAGQFRQSSKPNTTEILNVRSKKITVHSEPTSQVKLGANAESKNGCANAFSFGKAFRHDEILPSPRCVYSKRLRQGLLHPELCFTIIRVKAVRREVTPGRLQNYHRVDHANCGSEDIRE